MSADNTMLAVYKSPRHDMMYLYLAVDDEENADLGVIPEELLQRFGKPVFTLTLELWPERRLAQADAAVVLAAVSEQGFYLQMPPKVTLAPTPDELNVHS